MSILNSCELTEEDVSQPDEPCEGIYFRAKEYTYVGGRGELCFMIKLLPLKRRSCKGCCECGCFSEDLSSIGTDAVHLPERIVHDGIYRLRFVSGGKDWETGLCEEWWWELDLIKDKE